MTKVNASQYLPEENKIFSAAIEVTNKCTNQCTHCYACSSPSQSLMTETMPTQAFEAVILQLLEHNVPSIQFIGGEPLLHPEIGKFITLCGEGGAKKVEVYTNLTTLTEDHLSLFQQYGVHVATSYYSPYEEIHRVMTSSLISVRRVDENIKRCVNAGLTLRVAIIRTDKNTDHIDVTKKHLYALGVTDVSVDDVRNLGRQKDTGSGDTQHALCGNCGKNQVAISHDGKYFPCVMSRVSVGAVNECSFSEIPVRLLEYRFQKLSSIAPEDVVFASNNDGGFCPPQQGCKPNNPPCQPRLTCQPSR